MLLVLLLLFGSKNLPGMARTLGKTLESFRRAAREVSDEIMHAEEADPETPSKLPHAVAREDEQGEDEPPS